MPLDLLVIISITLFFAAILHGSIGFGFPMIATPIIALFTDMQTAIFYTLIPTLLVNLVSIQSEKHFWSVFKQFAPFAFITAIGSFLGTLVLLNANADTFKLLLALIILIYLFMDKYKIKTTFVQNHPKKSLGLFGIGAGLMGGLTNVMAPVLIVYSLESKHTKSQTIQFSNLCFLFGKIIQIIVFSFYATFSTQKMGISLATLFIVGLALFLGVRIKRRIDAKSYKIFIKGLLLVMALMLVGQVSF